MPHNRVVAFVALVASAVIAAPANAAIPLDLGTLPSARLTGQPGSAENAGAALASCDLDGDGKADLVTGAPGHDLDLDRFLYRGRVYVTLTGQRALDSGSSTMTLTPGAAGAGVGTAIDCAGDVNADGVDDLVLGAPGAKNPAGKFAGAAYVVFGSRRYGGGTQLDVSNLGGRGFAVYGPTDAASDFYNAIDFGSRVAGVGKVGGPTAAIAIGASIAAPDGAAAVRGSVFVITGRASTTAVDLAVDPGAARLRVDGPQDNVALGAVDGVGDISGDGVPDLLVTAPLLHGPNDELDWDGMRTDRSGAAFVVDGAATGTVSLADWASPSSAVLFPIWGANGHQMLGTNGAGIGDNNGDGIPDIGLSAPDMTYFNGDPTQLKTGTYVVFGKHDRAPVDLKSAGGAAYAIRSPIDTSNYTGVDLGASMAGTGDLNGDGKADLLLGAPGISAGGKPNLGGAYLIYGRAITQTVDAGTLTAPDGARIIGARANDRLGTAVTSGDFLGDGAPQLVVGAFWPYEDVEVNVDGFAQLIRLGAPGPGDDDDDDGPTVPGAPTVAELDWGFRERFRNYVYGGDGHPPIAVTGGARCTANPDAARGGCDPKLRATSSEPLPPADALHWQPTGQTLDPTTHEGTVTGEGTVTFDYPAHKFTMKVSDPRFTIAAGAVSVSIHLRIDSTLPTVPSIARRLTIGQFPIDGPITVANGLTVVHTKGGTVSAEGAAALGGFLSAGQELDPITLAVPATLPPAQEPDDDEEESQTPDDGQPPAPLAPVVPAPVVVPPPAVQPPAVGFIARAGRTTTARITLAKSRRSVTLVLARRLGAPDITYNVRLVRRDRTVALGTLKNRTLKAMAPKGRRLGLLSGTYAIVTASPPSLLHGSLTILPKAARQVWNR